MLFVISSTFASVAGALVAPRWGYVEPGVAFSPFVSFQVVIMALLGGTHRLWGPLLGVIPFVLLWELISIVFPTQTTLLLGVCFLLIVYVIPNGMTGLIEDAMKRRGRHGGAAAAPRALRPGAAEPPCEKSQNAQHRDRRSTGCGRRHQALRRPRRGRQYVVQRWPRRKCWV